MAKELLSPLAPKRSAEAKRVRLFIGIGIVTGDEKDSPGGFSLQLPLEFIAKRNVLQIE